MPTLYLRAVPKDLLRKLRVRAAAERRSASREAIALLERALEADAAPDVRFRAVLARLRRRQVEGTRHRGKRPSTEELVREERER